MQEFIYRTLGPEDADAYQILRVEGVKNFPLGFLLTIEEALSASAERCRKTLAARGFRGVFVDDKLIGFCGYRHLDLTRTRHRGEIGPFFVAEEFHGSEAANKLMSGVIREAKESGIERLELYVDRENRRAIAFYEKQGFRYIGTLHDSVRIEGVSRTDCFYALQITK